MLIELRNGTPILVGKRRIGELVMLKMAIAKRSAAAERAKNVAD